MNAWASTSGCCSAAHGVRHWLAYAQQHAQHVHALILRGIFLCRPPFQWFYQERRQPIVSRLLEDYLAPIPKEERDDLMQAFHKRLTSTDEIAQMHAARLVRLGGSHRHVAPERTGG